jgi:hypothetical protein
VFLKVYHNSKEDEMGGSCSTHGRNAYKILVGKPEEIFILVSEMSPQVTVGQPPIRWVTGALSLGGKAAGT